MKYLLQIIVAFAIVAAAFYTINHRNRPLPNILLISVDTLRADHLSCYGYHRPSPNIDALAKDSVLFENTTSQAPWTTASHMSLFTSLYPTVHRVTHEALSEVQTTLPVLLQKKGYQTAAFVEATALDPRFGFGRGFNQYHRKSNDPSARANNERVLQWLDQRKPANPFFLFVHYYDVHRKYQPPPPFNKIYSPTIQDVDYLITGPYGRRRSITFQEIYDIVAMYDGEIRYVDEQIRNLLQNLKNRGLYRNSLIVLLADHGEGFLDHSLMDHGNSLYQELLHVPLFIKLPGNKFAGRRVSSVSRLIDVFPTVLDWLHIKPEHVIQGQSLLPILQGMTPKPQPAFASGAVGSECIVLDNWKLIHNAELQKRLSLVPLALRAEYELYNLKIDPQEYGNIADSNLAKRDELLTLLLAQRKVNEKLNQRINTQHQPLDHEIEEQLRSLGYIQ